MTEFPATIDESGDIARLSAATLDDPWDLDDQIVERRDNWLLSYIDILTLFLTLLVVLLSLQPREESPIAETQPGQYHHISPVPIERPANNRVNRATETGRSTSPWPDTGLADAEGQAGNVSSEKQPGIPLISQISFSPLRVGFPDIGIPQMENLEQPTVVDEASRSAKPQQADPPADVAQEPDTPDNARAERFIHDLAQLNLDDRLRITQVEEGVHLEVSDRILFALGSTDLKTEGTRLLDDLFRVFVQQQGRISVEGHTDDRPIANLRFPSNWELSSGRATQVARYLIQKGIAPERLRAIGYADTRPLESNVSIEGRSRNRRVALIVELTDPVTAESTSE